MNVIKATLEELPDIVLLNAIVQKMHHQAHPDIFKPVGDESGVERLFERILEQENNHVFMAYLANAPVGYAWAAVEARPDFALKHGRKQVYIHQIAVHERYRKQGIGRALFQTIEDLAEQQGITHLELDSWAFNTDAHAFFEKLGFETYNIKMWKKGEHHAVHRNHRRF